MCAYLWNSCEQQEEKRSAVIAVDSDVITDVRQSHLRHEPPVDEQRQEHPLMMVRHDSYCQQQGGYRS